MLSRQHPSLVLLALLDTWVNELWKRIVSISFVSLPLVLKVWFSARSQVRDTSGQFLQLSAVVCSSVHQSCKPSEKDGNYRHQSVSLPCSVKHPAEC